ncbi:MAG: iron ABC transporter permease [Gemmatimonadota bacterium]
MIVLGLVVVTVVAVLIGVGVGAVSFSPGSVVAALLDPNHPNAAIIRQIRLPRVVLAWVVGGGLGVCGASLQALVRNPLAEPYLLGISGGAGLGAVLGIALGWASFAVPAAAFVGALAAIGLVYRLAAVSGQRLDPRVLVLAGVVVGAFCSAVMTGILTLTGEARLRDAFLWLLGGFSAASWPTVGLFAAYAAGPLAALWYVARPLDLLTLGDEPAQALGIPVERTKRIAYVAASLLAAASVAVAGLIGFVGLVTPHALRNLIGPAHRRLLPAVFVASGSFLVLADALARTVVRPTELPVGVMTAAVGVPIFALLLRRMIR